MNPRYLEIDDRTDELRAVLRRNKDRARDFQAKFDCSLIYHDNALEGVVFSSHELLAALDPDAMASDAATAPVFAAVRNHKAALELLRNEARDRTSRITVALMKKLQEMLCQGLGGRDKTGFRRDVPLHRSYFHEIAQPAKIPELLDNVAEIAGSAELRELHPVSQAATVQWHFMQVFPFPENNGKVARLLSHLVLIHAGYLPAIIHSIDRQRYYESLRLPVSSLQQLVLEAMENSLDNAFQFFSQGTPIHVNRASGE